MPLPPRQPYAFASSNPSAASSSQHQLYNRNQQPQRQPPNAPRRGYTAAPGAASAVSLLPHSQRDAGSDSVVRISNRSTRFSSSGSHCSLFSAALESFQCPSPRSGTHNLRQGEKHARNRHSSLAHSLPGSRAPLDAQDRTTIPVAMCGIPSASSISRKYTTSLSVNLLMAGMPRSTATGSTARGSASNKRPPPCDPRGNISVTLLLTRPKCGAYGFVTIAGGSVPVASTCCWETHGAEPLGPAWSSSGGFLPTTAIQILTFPSVLALARSFVMGCGHIAQPPRGG